MSPRGDDGAVLLVVSAVGFGYERVMAARDAQAFHRWAHVTVDGQTLQIATQFHLDFRVGPRT